MPSLGFPELIVILVIALILFGPGKLPSVGGAIGKAFSEFKKASKDLTSDEPDSNNSLKKNAKVETTKES